MVFFFIRHRFKLKVQEPQPSGWGSAPLRPNLAG